MRSHKRQTNIIKDNNINEYEKICKQCTRIHVLNNIHYKIIVFGLENMGKFHTH